jgi:superfamily II DNA or RNA helicase
MVDNMDIVTIKKYDETYVKVFCDPGIAQEICDHFTFDVPNAKFTPAYKNKMWDGKIKIFNSLSCLLYVGLIEALEKFCGARSYKIEYETSFSDTEFSVKEAKDFIETLNLKYEPRDYQLNTFVHSVRKRRALLLSPTASGKSMMIYLLTRYYRDVYNKKTLIIVPTTSLVHQMTSDFEDYGLESNSIHKIMGGLEKNSEDHNIFVSTWQSIYKLPKTWFEQFGLVIGDEAHLFKASSLTSIMGKLNRCVYRFGFTGTLDGTLTNKLVLEGIFGPVKKVTTTSELIEKKHLAGFNIKALVLKYPDEIKKQIAGLDYQTEIDYIVTNKKRNKFIKNLALSLEGNTLLLFQFVEKQGKILYEMIENEIKDRKVFFISGNVDADKREEIRKLIETEKNSIIVASFGTSSTGINIKNLHNIIFASPSKSRVRNLQSIGRGLRKSETKTDAVLYDISDDLSWKNKKNYTILHFIERIKIYNEEQFPYKIYNVVLL